MSRLSPADPGGRPGIEAFSALARAFPAEHPHVVDLPYRLGSWALDEPENCRLWLDGAGRLLAWGALQTPFWLIEYGCHPKARSGLLDEILGWGAERARQVAGTPYGRPSWFVEARPEDEEGRQALERAGFAAVPVSGSGSWSRVWMRAVEGPPDRVPPPGFAIRPLAGEVEAPLAVELQRSFFETSNMTLPWRLRLLRHPAYDPALDVVAVARGGRVAGLCLGWYDAPSGTGQVEPVGVLHEERGRGLGRAIVAECVRRLLRRGAREVLVEVDAGNAAALALYRSLGFRPFQDVVFHRREPGGAA